MVIKLDRYTGETQHGYHWIDYDGTMKSSKTLYGIEPEEYFKYAPYVKWWYVRCELDWYRMRKEIRKLEEDTLRPIRA